MHRTERSEEGRGTYVPGWASFEGGREMSHEGLMAALGMQFNLY